MGRVSYANISHIFAGHGRIEDAATPLASLNLNDLLCQIQISPLAGQPVRTIGLRIELDSIPCQPPGCGGPVTKAVSTTRTLGGGPTSPRV